MGHNEICRLMAFVLEKLEDEPLKKRVELYEIVSELIPDEGLSQQLQFHSRELRLLEQKFKNLKLGMNSNILP
jgi:hypothetical protein